MYARHRSPGNGYRSNSMGMGIAPEGSARGHGFYNSEHQSFNRGFGRGHGQPKSFQQLPPTLQKGDILLEAGRLAAEYLVSQGLLPPNALSGKWQNGTFRDGESLQLPSEGRSSTLTRPGNSGSDVESGRRRYPGDYNSIGLRNYLKNRRRGRSFRSYGSDFGREYARSGSWSERSKVSPGMEGDDDSYSGHQEDQHTGKYVGNGLQKSVSGEFAPKLEEANGLGSEMRKYNQDEMASRASSSSTGKDLLHEADWEFSKKAADSTNMNVETEELKDDTGKDEIERHDAEDPPIKHHADAGDTLSKSNTNLLVLCKFAKVPTKTRSSLSYKGIKVDSISNNDEKNTCDIKHPGASKVLIEDGFLGNSAVDVLSNKTRGTNCPDSEISKPLPAQPVDGVGSMVSAFGVDQGKCMRSQSFPDRALTHDIEKETIQGPSGLPRSSSTVNEKGEKRTMEENDARDGTKKLREWFPTMVTRAEELFSTPNLSEKKAIPQEEKTAPDEMVTPAFDEESSVNNYQFPMAGGEPCVEYAQEKQLFPGSFKICDLNLMEASDLNENHHRDPNLIYPAIPEKEATPVDVGLSMSNSSMVSGSGYGRGQSDRKGIEIIDLEDDSAPEAEANDNSERKTETMFTGLEGFPNNSQNAGQIPDLQDNYDGLTVTHLLNTFPDCPPVPGDINPLQNEMVLHNGEGALADDDSIYMSLGEIPLSFLQAWEQPPPQEYEKPF